MDNLLALESASQGARDMERLKGAADRTQAAAKMRSPQAMRETAIEFEAVFLSQLLRPMFENLKTSEPFGGGRGEEVWRSLLLDEYGKSMAKAGGIGIADHVYRQMMQLQEGQQ